MIEGLQPYGRYRQCDLVWASRLPRHWGLPRLGAILEERRETNETREIAQVLSVLKDIGVVPYEEKGNIGNKKSEDTRRYKIVRPDDIVMNSMNVIIGSVGRSRFTGCLSPVYYVLKRRFAEDNPQYLEAIFNVKPFQQSLVRIGNGILAHRLRIPMELLKCELLPKPPPDEQASIVQFLDHANRKIERFIRAKKKLIALLNEQKQAIIHRAVTRGLDPNVPMKDSGVHWMGEIPKHWEVKRLGSLLRERGERNDSGSVTHVLSLLRQRGVIPYDEKGNIGNKKSTDITRYKIVRPNDIVMNCMNVIIGSVGISRYTGCLSPVYYVLMRRNETDSPDYLNGIFQSSVFHKSLVRIGYGILAHRMRIPMALLKRELLPYPPITEQFLIVEFVRAETEAVDRVIERTFREIELLREYRTGLISDVVTGQLDVREAVKLLPREELSAEHTDGMNDNLDDNEEIEEDVGV